MLQGQIISVDNATALVLPPEAKTNLGLKAGDTVNLTIQGGHMVVSPVHDQDEAADVDAIIEDVFKERDSAYRRLAEGHS